MGPVVGLLDLPDELLYNALLEIPYTPEQFVRVRSINKHLRDITNLPTFRMHLAQINFPELMQMTGLTTITDNILRRFHDIDTEIQGAVERVNAQYSSVRKDAIRQGLYILSTEEILRVHFARPVVRPTREVWYRIGTRYMAEVLRYTLTLLYPLCDPVPDNIVVPDIDPHEISSWAMNRSAFETAVLLDFSPTPIRRRTYRPTRFNHIRSNIRALEMITLGEDSGKDLRDWAEVDDNDFSAHRLLDELIAREQGGIVTTSPPRTWDDYWQDWNQRWLILWCDWDGTEVDEPKELENIHFGDLGRAFLIQNAPANGTANSQ